MTTPPHIVAVVASGSADIVGRQTQPVARVFGGREALRQAVGSGAEWLWILGRGARPRDDALARLVAGIQNVGPPRAALAAGAVLDDAGRVCDSQLGIEITAGIPETLRLVQLRMLPLRHTPLTHCLVARDMFLRHGFPDTRRFGSHASVEWTARVLREEPGYLVPASVVVLPEPAERPSRWAALCTLPHTVRTIRTGVWTTGESVRALVRIVERRANLA